MNNQQQSMASFQALDRISKLEKTLQRRDQISSSEIERVDKNTNDIKANKTGITELGTKVIGVSLKPEKDSIL